MTTTASQFERVAESVAKRTSELLCARVAVIDDRGVIVAGSEPGRVGRVIDLDGPELADCLRVPIHFDGQAGEVIVAEPDGDETVSPRMAQVLVELVLGQTAMVARLPNQHLWKNKLIHDLLHGLATDESGVLREAQILGMDLRRPRAVVLIDASDYILAPGRSASSDVSEAQVRRRSQLVIASVVSFFALPNDTICGYIGDGEVAVLKASSSHDLAAWMEHGDEQEAPNASWANLTALKRAGTALLARIRRDTNVSINIGIGRYHPGIRGLARSYEDARAALSLGRRFRGPNQVHCLDGLGVAAFVGIADERTKIDLATHLLSPLDHEPGLLETLTVFFEENCCPSSTAERLAIHRNTLSYRLDKAASLTGLDPRRFDDAVQIRLALLLRTFRGEAA
jgi:carbohydrate diacid regulator